MDIQEEKHRRYSRRDFLRMSALGATGALLAGCTVATAPQVTEKEVVDSKEVETVEEAEQSAESTTEAPAAEAVVLNFGHHWEAAFRAHQEEFDNQFMERHPEISIKSVYNTWADHNQIVPTWAAAGTLPDIIYVHGSRAYPWAHEGITVSIQEHIDNDSEFNVAGIWEEALKLYQYEGQQHDIPYDHGPILLGYNKDIFDAAGEAYPTEEWTMDNLREVAAKLTDVDNQQWGWSGALPNLNPSVGGPTLYPWGATFMNEAQDAITLDTPEAKEAMQFWADLILQDKSAPTAAESLAFEQGPWISGQVAMAHVASWDTPTLATFASFNWDVAPWPSGPKGRGTGSFGSGFGITGTSQNVDAGWTYLREYLSTEGMTFLWGSTGRGSPARKDAYESWMNSEVAPEHAEYFLDALENYAKTDPPYATLAAPEILDICNREGELIRNGDKTVDEAIATIMEEGKAAMDKVSG
jgi:multiple sugar transport system substrate-binding protein